MWRSYVSAAVWKVAAPATSLIVTRIAAGAEPVNRLGRALHLVAVGDELLLGRLELLRAVAARDVRQRLDQLRGVLGLRGVGRLAERAGELVQPVDDLLVRARRVVGRG